MKFVQNTASLIVSLFIVTSALGQHFPSQQYMTSDGMPSNSVFDIAQTSSGVMWFITKSGPAYYDASEWHYFPEKNDLPSSIQGKIIATDEVIWVAGMNKREFTLQYFAEGKWSSLTPPFQTTTPNEPFSFQVVSSGDSHDVFMGSGSTLYLLNSTDLNTEQHDLQENIYNIRKINQQILISTDGGVWEYSDGSPRKINLPYQELPNTKILDVQRTNDKFYLLGYEWYAELTEERITYLSKNLRMTSSSLVYQCSLIIDKTGNVFYGAFTTPRILNRDNNSWDQMLIDGKEINIGSTSLFCDKENNLWVSDSRGLFKFNILQFTNYNRSSGLLADEVTAVQQLPDSTLIIANPLALNILKKGKIKSYPINSEGKHTNRILDLAIRDNEIIVAANESGLLSMNISSSAPLVKRLDYDKKISAVENFNNNLYASANDGIYSVEDGNLRKLADFSTIRNMAVLEGKLYLFSNSKGIVVFDEKSYVSHNSENFDLNNVYSGVEFNGELLFATADGLATIVDSTIVHWNKIQLRSPVYSLLVDSKGRLWVGTDQGVYLYENGTQTQFDQNEGLAGSEVNRNALMEDFQGRIWIGTERGVSVFQTSLIPKREINHSVELISAQVTDGQDIRNLENRNVPFDLNNVMIRFRCYSYIDEEQINFRYRMLASDTTWVLRSDATSAIVFNNLAPSEYQFEIQARLGNREWGPSTTLNFTIKPPFYLTGWFILSAAFILVVLIRLIFHYRYLLLIRQQRRLKALVAQRTREIELLNEQLEEKVKERTSELEKKNMLLEEYAYINAHHLRGPLTKIMSAIYVAETGEEDLLDVKVIKILKDAVKELDDVIYSINGILRTEE